MAYENAGGAEGRHQNGVEDTVTGHFGIKTLWDTSAPISRYFGTKKCGTRHFDTSAVIEEKPAHFDPGQFR